MCCCKYTKTHIKQENLRFFNNYGEIIFFALEKFKLHLKRITYYILYMFCVK